MRHRQKTSSNLLKFSRKPILRLLFPKSNASDVHYCIHKLFADSPFASRAVDINSKKGYKRLLEYIARAAGARSGGTVKFNVVGDPRKSPLLSLYIVNLNGLTFRRHFYKYNGETQMQAFYSDNYKKTQGGIRRRTIGSAVELRLIGVKTVRFDPPDTPDVGEVESKIPTTYPKDILDHVERVKNNKYSRLAKIFRESSSRVKFGRVKDVAFLYTPSEEAVKNRLQTLFQDAPHFKDRGGPLHPDNHREFLEHLASSVAAPRGSQIHLIATTGKTLDGPSDELWVSVRHPNGFRARRVFYRNDDKTELYNISQDGSSIRGTGYKRTLRSINSLRKLGVDHVWLYAGGNRSTLEPHLAHSYQIMSGYLAWPKMGFDGDLSDEQFARLPLLTRLRMGSNRKISKLYSLIGGEESWKNYGDTIKLHFWTNNKEFVNRLLSYVKRRRAREIRSSKSKR